MLADLQRNFKITDFHRIAITPFGHEVISIPNDISGILFTRKP